MNLVDETGGKCRNDNMDVSVSEFDFGNYKDTLSYRTATNINDPTSDS